MAQKVKEIVKDPDSELDWQWDWSEWLAAMDDDVLDAGSSEFIATGLTIINSNFDSVAGTATVWVSGGTLGEVAEVTCRIRTVAGRVEDSTKKFYILAK